MLNVVRKTGFLKALKCYLILFCDLQEKGDEMFAIEDIIDLAIQIEENGEKVYRNAAETISNPSLVSLLQWLADEEVKHAKWFSELKQKVRKSTDDPRLAEIGKSILLGLLGDETFSLKDADFSKIDQIKELLTLAIEFERDTVLFYEMMRPFIEEKETLDHLDAIIEEENSHIRLLQESLDSGIVDPSTDPQENRGRPSGLQS